MFSTTTLTFGDQAENHVGMQKIGNLCQQGLDVDDINALSRYFQERGYEVERHVLTDLLPEENRKGNEAVTIVIRQGAAHFVDVNALFEEQQTLRWDQKALMYGRVVNKHARHNLCYSDAAQEADFEAGKGTIVAFSQVPLLSRLRDGISESFVEACGNQKCGNLVVEGNHYHDSRKCGIGYHGDSERRIVIGVRLGHRMPLHFRWYHRGEIVGKTLKLALNSGDLYVSTEKAVGTDWKRKTTYTLRHAAGSAKFLDEANDQE
jgi:hypothetical protein